MLATRSLARTTGARRAASTVASSSSGRQRLVILGSGWGGYQVLKGTYKDPRYDVTIVSPSSHFNFTPLLASCAVGTLEYRSAIEPVRRFAPQATFHEAWCDSIDFSSKKLLCTSATPSIWPSTTPPGLSSSDPTIKAAPVSKRTRAQYELPYDKLVISVGAYSQTFGTPGVKDHGIFLKDIKDARAIRTRLLECLELASSPTTDEATRRQLLTFCIVGGGPTGVEFATSLHDFVDTDVRRHYGAGLADLIRIKLYDVAPDILSMFDVTMRKYAVKTLQQERVELLTGHHVERVEPGVLYTKEEGQVPFGLLVWSTGLAPNPLLSAIDDKGVEKHPRTGSLVTDGRLNLLRRSGEELKPDEDVWAIGDAAVVQEAVLPATAQVASQKAKYVVRQLIKGGERPFQYRYMGSMVNLGETRAAWDRTTPDGGLQLKHAGRLSWLLWHSAYFTMTLSTRNKILVPMFWFLTRIFGRDLSRF